MKKHFVIRHGQKGNRLYICQHIMDGAEGDVVKITPPTRTLEQNSKLWPMLADVSKQVNWHGNKLTGDEWKDVFTAAIEKQKVVPGIDGGFVVCGAKTSQYSKPKFAEMIELIYAFGAQQSVVWSDPAERAA
ncbi:recombination protein NinB [Glaciimonas immobilis]|uniref:NinB protein n=1 Tax=Glaciimonas immobilis TaxID=728004 RepID=A0A840RT25_9BURK|nr:recombination protein NinB [Glaciimonas immobilis]KAF3997515.1 recombination protein NinB [Glaciimonas immobilis]MBB5200803.1 hypothetical protein [Glaciimonas immobilis]